MFREKIPSRQLSAWLSAALIPVLIQTMAGMPWVWLALVCIISGAAVWAVWRWGARTYPNWLSAAQMIFLAILLGKLMEEVGRSWPTGHQTAVPLIVLAVAVWSALKGPSAAARVGCVLFWFIIVVYLVVFGAGVKDVDADWLKPRSGSVAWIGVVLTFLPGAASVLLQPGQRWGVRLLLPVVFALAGSLITVGVLSPEVAEASNDPFYELGRSLNLLGIAKRFEAVISAAITVGWFALMTLLLSLCGTLFEQIKMGGGRIGVWFGAILSAALMLCGLHIPMVLIVGLAAVFWVILPLLTQGMDFQKKS